MQTQFYNLKDLYFGLLKTEVSRDRYLFFNAIRVMLMELLHLPRNNFENTDQLFLKEKKWQIMLNKLLGYELSEIKEFQRNLLRKVRRVKHEKQENLLNYMRGSDFNATFFLREAISAFILKVEEKERQADKMAAKLAGESTKSKAEVNELTRTRGRSLYEYLRIDDSSSPAQEEELKETRRRQKEVLKQEIKRQIKLINR